MKLEWKTCLKIGISIFILYLCIHYWSAVSNILALCFKAALPLIIGAILAYITNILLRMYEKIYFPKSKKASVIKSRRIVCIILSIITEIAIVALVTGLIVPQLVECVKVIVGELPTAINFGIANLEKLNIVPNDVLSFLKSTNWQSKIGEIANVLTSGIGSVMDILIKTITSVFSGLFTAFLSIIFSFYLLISKDKLSKQIRRFMKHYFPSELNNRVVYVADVFNSCFRNYIVGQCTEALILGVLCTIGLLLLRIPYAAMISALIAFTALIPIVGPYIGSIIGAFMILTLSPIKALIFLAFIIILQQVEGNLIYPRVVGSSIGLPSIWVLAAITIGGGILGVWGMLLGVPVAASIYHLIRNDMNNTKKI